MNWKDKLKTFLKALPIWVVMLGPVLLMGYGIIDAVLHSRFLHVEVYWLGVLLGLLPTIVLGGMMLLRRFVKVRYGVLLVTALLGLLYFLPLGLIISAFSMDFYSETEDIAHYRQVTDQFFFWYEDADRLFPAQPGADGSYYYYCDYDSDQVLYAEWTLPPEELAAEITRAEEILSASERYLQMQQGSFTCLIEKAWVSPDFTPFQLEERVGFHSLTMFAWDEKTGRVRYILCDEQVSLDEPPYYMTLDWQ